MPITVNHSTPADDSFSASGATAWNANHSLVGVGTMAEQNANNVAITGGTATLTSVTTPIVQATNSAGLALKNSAGTSQISMGAGGGDNVTIAVSTNLNGANAQIDISPTGTGHVHIKPTGTGAVEIAPTNVGTMNNMVIGGTTPLAITGTTITATTFSGSGASLTSIPNSALVNSAITINGTSTSLGGSISVGTVTSVTGTAPVVSSGGATPAISMAAANTTTNGYLTSTDWTTFNNKGSGTVTSVTATSPVTSTGGATPVIAMPAATTSVNGYLTSTDWTTFNGKQATLVSGTNIKTVSGTTLLGSGDLGVIGATYGGTGQSSYAVGDIVYASTTTALSKLADVATGNALISGGVGVAPSYGKIGLTTHVSGTLPVANGGTNATTASITSFNNITGYTASGATGTTSTNLVFSTAPTVTNPTLTGFIETVFAATGTTPALSPTNGTIQTWTLSGSSTPTAGTWAAGASLSLQITASTNTITWSSMPVTWMGGTAPTLSTTVTTNIELWKIGSTIYGALVGLA